MIAVAVEVEVEVEAVEVVVVVVVTQLEAPKSVQSKQMIKVSRALTCYKTFDGNLAASFCISFSLSLPLSLLLSGSHLQWLELHSQQ